VDIVLFARPDRVPNEADIVASLVGSGYAVSEPRSREEVAAAVDRAEAPTVLIVDLLSTLARPGEIDGYIAFLRDYAALRETRPLSLIVIEPPLPQQLDTFFGSGDLVTAYLREPVDPQVLVGLLRRIAEGP
jgi:hypothetical protein